MDEIVELESFLDVGRVSGRMMMGAMVVLLEDVLAVLSCKHVLPYPGCRDESLSPVDVDEVAWML